jgi:imidazolonepropionase-like amidohydrolase
LDVKTGKTLANQTILIQGDKITSVGSDPQIPAGAQVVDLSNATVLPGLIDAHTHLTLTTNFGYSRLGISMPREALNGARNARVTLDAGFTTVRNVGASGFHRRGFARCHQCGRCPGTAHAGQRPGAEHYGRPLRRELAAV